MPKKTIADFRKEVAQLKQELYECGARKRPTLMDPILEEEQNTASVIQHIMNSCEEKTGRQLNLLIERDLEGHFAVSSIGTL